MLITFCPGAGTDPTYSAGKPITEDPPCSVGSPVRPRSGLTAEGQELLVALKRFAVSLVHPREDQQKEQKSPANLDEFQEVSSGFRYPTTDIANVVEPDTSAYIQLLDGWDGHIWEASGLGRISSSECYFRPHM